MLVLFTNSSSHTCAQNRRKPQLSARQIAERVLPSVVVLVAESLDAKTESHGSGFFIREDVIATNYHVVKGATSIYVKVLGPPGESLVDRLLREKEQGLGYLAGIMEFDEQADLAVLKVFGTKRRPLPLSRNSSTVGDLIYVVGNPEGLEGTFSQGIVSALRGSRYIQITAPISHGSSGGPVLNNKGEVIGVAVGAISNGQNLNFAVPIALLLPLVTRSKRS